MKFNSQICTTREQSEKLLALGLKKETADMVWNIDWCCSEDAETILALCEHHPNQYFPAWSLHRIIEMIYPTDIHIDILSPVILPRENIYDYVIEMIERKIKEGYFPKEYLEE